MAIIVSQTSSCPLEKQQKILQYPVLVYTKTVDSVEGALCRIGQSNSEYPVPSTSEQLGTKWPPGLHP